MSRLRSTSSSKLLRPKVPLLQTVLIINAMNSLDMSASTVDDEEELRFDFSIAPVDDETQFSPMSHAAECESTARLADASPDTDTNENMDPNTFTIPPKPRRRPSVYIRSNAVIDTVDSPVNVDFSGFDFNAHQHQHTSATHHDSKAALFPAQEPHPSVAMEEPRTESQSTTDEFVASSVSPARTHVVDHSAASEQTSEMEPLRVVFRTSPKGLYTVSRGADDDCESECELLESDESTPRPSDSSMGSSQTHMLCLSPSSPTACGIAAFSPKRRRMCPRSPSAVSPTFAVLL